MSEEKNCFSEMPKGTALTWEERGKVLAFKESGLSIRVIASKIKRSKTVVQNLIKMGSNYAKKIRPGRKSSVNARDKRRIFDLASNKHHNASQIKDELHLSVGTRRVQQILHHDGRLHYEKRQPNTNLLPRHKSARIAFAEKYQYWDDEWHSVIFSDEKKWNLDGPDGNQFYWHDKRKKKEVRLTRNFGGGSLMIWGGFGYNGKTPVCFVSSKMNSQKYIDLLDDALINYGDDIGGPNYIFQQDNASIHASRATKEFLSSRNIPVLDWPAISPDLNPIENIWGILSKRVYLNGRQFNTVKELRKSVQDEWDKLEPEMLRKLVDSMPNRLQQVIINKGGHIKY